MYQQLLGIGLFITLGFSNLYCMNFNWENAYTWKNYKGWQVTYDSKTNTYTGQAERYSMIHDSSKYFEVIISYNNGVYESTTFNEYRDGNYRGDLDPVIVQDLFKIFKEKYEKANQTRTAMLAATQKLLNK